MRSFALLAVAASIACSAGGTDAAGSSPEAAAIHTIQGSGATSPLAGRKVRSDGVVTGDFQDDDADDRRNLGGFFIQDPSPDADPASSEGLFVYDGAGPSVDVAVGDRVIVEGTVTEFFGETQIAATRVRIEGRGTVAPTDVELPAARLAANGDGEPVADLERYEGMLVRFPQELTVGDLHLLERFGEIALTQGGRRYQFTNGHAPDRAGYAAHLREQAAGTLLLDDGRRAQYAAPVAFAAAGFPRVGDVVVGLTGTLRYSRGSGSAGSESYRLMPVGNPVFVKRNPRPGPPRVEGALRVASFNVLNLFSTLDRGGATCGPAGKAGCRGADTAAELERQLAKCATAIRAIDADILALVELQNDGGATLRLLADRVEGLSGRRYAFVDAGVVGPGPIANGFLYDAGSVDPQGSPAILDSGVDPGFDTRLHRPAIAQTFRDRASSALLTVVVVHLKSKGSSCEPQGDPDLGDGQGDCNRTRTRAAKALARWIATDPTASGGENVLIVGDLNAYAREDPLTALEAAGWSHLPVDGGTDAEAYSFVFAARSGALDHALASPRLAPHVTGVAEWHINADEPPLLDYNLERDRDPALFDATTPYRSSDHDPLIVGIDLAAPPEALNRARRPGSRARRSPATARESGRRNRPPP